MKIVVIGDIHGHNSWKDIINIEKNSDLIIFLGDYFDSFTVEPQEQLSNYLDIKTFRDSNSDKVITLIGNHDYQYLYDVKYSGWNPMTNLLAKSIITEDFNDGKLRFAYKYNDILFSHAGITRWWMENVACCSLEDLLNNEVSLKHFHWNSILGNDPHGDTISNSPIWVRPKSLFQSKLYNFKHVVGHTNCKNAYATDNVWICDSLPNDYLVIDNDEFLIKKIK